MNPFDSNKPVMCWQHFRCDQTQCPAYRSKAHRCWLVTGTHCHGGIQGQFIEKIEMCLDCQVFKNNMSPEALSETCRLVRSQFQDLGKQIASRDRKAEKLQAEMAQGLSEVSAALKKIYAGDPSVRIPETSSLDEIKHLKKLVNACAENLSDIVELAHEFAIGLAEHFDVLHRVTSGDLSARIKGESKVELLESLKKVTNQTIESVAREMADRKQTETSLRESETRFRTFVEQAPIGITIMRPDMTFEFINATFTHLFGYTRKDLPDKYAWFEKAYPDKEYRNQVQHAWGTDWEPHAPPGAIMTRTFKVRCKNGEDKIVSFQTVILPEGEHFMAYTDITEKTQAEQEKRKLETQLRRSQKMEAIGTLAGGVAHDLNNILSGIVSYPELLLMDLPAESPLRKPIQIIHRSGEKAAAIVQDLLTLARRGVAVTKVVNLNQIITEFLKSPEYQKLTAFHTTVEVAVDLTPDLFNINASPVHVAKTVMNLVANAAEAMPEGGTVMITTANKYVDQPIRGYDEVSAGHYVTLTVSDTGVGISHDDLDKIFEPFYTKKVMGRSGTGLGMAVVWGTVKDLKGYIDVVSTENQGSCFTLYFPATEETVHQEIMDLPLSEYRGQGEKIMVVDDLAEQREIAAALLTKLGYQVVTAASGEEALAYLKDNLVDLLILDMIMEPGIDGLETYRRAIALRPNQKAIVASGFSLSQRVKDIRKLGVTIYLKKPYSMEKLGMAIRSELEK